MRNNAFLHHSLPLILSLCALCSLWPIPPAHALEPEEIEFRQSPREIYRHLRLMCVAAHPDDEDGATLACHRYKYGIKTYALIGTRGEGGQNEIGPELYEDLAVIRTKEMMDAANIEGAELHFLDMPDFGFSKTIEETFEKWGKDVLLEKMVRKIREIRPHVIITHHGRMKDHGHHQAIGWAVQEAFDKAADSGYLADDAHPAWQVQRLFIRDFTGESKDAAVIDISEHDEVRGQSYAEIAADALRAHKSQGMEIFIERLLSPGAKAYYDLVRQAEGTNPHIAPDSTGPLVAGVTYQQEEPRNTAPPAEVLSPSKRLSPVQLEFLGAPYLLLHSDPRTLEVQLRLTNHTPGAHVQELTLSAPEGWSIEPAMLNASFTKEADQQTVALKLHPPAEVGTGDYMLTAETAGLDFKPEAKVAVVDVALPPSFKDNVQPLTVDGKSLRIPNIVAPMTERRVAIIGSYDTTLHEVCTKLGIAHDFLEAGHSIGELLPRIADYTTIIIDMRAYGKRPDLRDNNAALLEWCKAGGRLIVMYHKTQDWSSDFAPYPIILSNNRVTREDAPVKMLLPEHPWFNYPNRIASADWDGWRQERGLYFPQQWDPAYTALIETTDPGEHIPPGSCLIADYGEGKYFYTALVWYRQLRELHPGALRLFVNMLSL